MSITQPPVRSPLMRGTAFVLLVTQLSACASSWKTVPEIPSPSERVRLWLSDGSNVEMSHPIVIGDSVVGKVASNSVRLVIASDGIRVIEIKKAATPIWQIVLGIVLTGALVAGIVVFRDFEGICGTFKCE